MAHLVIKGTAVGGNFMMKGIIAAFHQREEAAIVCRNLNKLESYSGDEYRIQEIEVLGQSIKED